MKIEAVVISGELPDSCSECDFMTYDGDCVIMREPIPREDDCPPDWCPLVRKDLYELEIIQNFVGKESDQQ